MQTGDVHRPRIENAMNERPHLRVIQGGETSTASTGRSRPEEAVSRDFNQSVPQDFDELFHRFAPYVAAIGIKLLGRNDELDDLVQDVFVEAHRGLGRIRRPESIKAWLATIAVRRATKRLRWLRVRSFLHQDDTRDFGTLVDTAATPEERAHVAMTYRWLERLPTAQRVVWVLRHVEGESLDEIARLCACSKSTVQRRLRAAQETLRNRIGHVRTE